MTMMSWSKHELKRRHVLKWEKTVFAWMDRHTHTHTPLDPLEGAADHVDEAPGWPCDRSHQTLAHALEEARGPLLLGS